MPNNDLIKNLRTKLLSPSLSLSYNDPIHIVKGKAQYLFDQTGKKYLDGINNIQHVGHCHPRIANAAFKQLKLLNTNTRYLDYTVLKYSQALIERLPEKLNVCFFTNSGSESNDLALRLARSKNKDSNTIVLDGAYHGHLTSLIEISPYKYKGAGGSSPPPYVHEVPMPDQFRGKFRGKNSSSNYLNEFKKTLLEIKKNNQNPAFIFESFMGCGGQIPLPSNFIKKAHTLVHENGGICIADEIQIGFGRLGKNFWGFEYHGLEPDIVTVGKSMGNGHPLSAVITTREIAEHFNNGMEYFNSFGGNPVSSTIGHEVLKIIKDEDLQKNAKNVGSYLKGMLLELQKDYSLIGNVRGEGLFLGIEIVNSNGSLEPLAKVAKYIVNEMKKKRALLSTDGPDENVIKIKPPIVFNEQNADFIVENLRSIISKI